MDSGDTMVGQPASIDRTLEPEIPMIIPKAPPKSGFA